MLNISGAKFEEHCFKACQNLNVGHVRAHFREQKLIAQQEIYSSFVPYRFLRAVKLNRAQSGLLYLLIKRHLLSCLVVCYELAQLLGNERMKMTGMEKGVNKSTTVGVQTN